MKSVLAVTNEVDDMLAAASDLSAQVKSKISLSKNSIGILLAEGESEPAELLPALEEGLGFDVIGCTVTAQISSLGYHRLSNSLLVLSADDCQFASQVSQPLDENFARQITETFNQARQKLGEEDIKAVFLFTTGNLHFTPDDTLAVINALAPGVPVFGGAAGDYFRFEDERVLANGQEYRNSLVLLLVSGNIQPTFIIRNIPRSSLATSVVTKSCGGVVESIDNMTVYDYMKKHDIYLDSDLDLYYAPLSVEYTDRDDDGQPVCRPFYTIDRTTGTAISHGKIPEGSRVSIRAIQKDDIIKTTTEAVEYIAGQVQHAPSGYAFSTIFGVTCAVRHIVLGLEHTFEGELAKKLLPANITFAGFYAYGEFCPTSVKQGRAQNKAHNLSIAFCLF